LSCRVWGLGFRIRQAGVVEETKETPIPAGRCNTVDFRFRVYT